MKFLIIVSFLGLFSCNKVATYSLMYGTEVPTMDSGFFKYSSSIFTDSTMKDLDTTVFYEEYNITEGKVERDVSDTYVILRFYSNGCINMFFESSNDHYPNPDTYNPKVYGRRGRVFSYEDKLYTHMYTVIGEYGKMGLSERTLEVKGDFIHLFYSKDYPPSVFKKKQVSNAYFKYKANW